MKMKMLLPWLCVLGLLAGAGWLYSTNRAMEGELAGLRDASQQLDRVRSELEESKGRQAQAETELSRLRKDQDELLRLRNEARQLRAEKQQLGKQVQTAQAQAQNAEARALRQSATPGAQGMPTAPGQTPEATAAAAAFASRYGLKPATPEAANAVACLANLRLIESAKQQWAVDNNKPGGTLVTMDFLAPYFRTNNAPVCPAGGVYTLNPIGLGPTCTVQGHALPR